MTTADIRYPAGEITPHGWWHLINDTHPMMRLRAYDGSIDTYLLGPLAAPFHDDIAGPEFAVVDDLKGLIPPWKNITQKGATQDGITYVDSLYDPTDVQMVLDCVGRDQRHLRRLTRDIIASIDAKQQSELQWYTQELGYWWAPVRWQDTIPDSLGNQQRPRQKLSLRLSADDAFWRSFDDVSVFQPSYESMKDTFTENFAKAKDCGPSWPQHYIGTGGGYCTMARGHMGWVSGQPGYAGREVVNGPYRDPDTAVTFQTATNNQVISIKLGSIAQVTWPDGAEEHIWGRMGHNLDGTWDGNGIKVQIGYTEIRLSRYNDFTETTMRVWPLLIPPLYGEVWTLVCGYEGNERLFRVLRGQNAPLGLEVGGYKEVGTASALGASYRGVGDGMRAGPALFRANAFFHQALPATIAWIQAGDNHAVSQSGFLKCTNIGDQPQYRTFTVFGPGTFRIYDGPGSADYVEIGPLLPNQVAYLNTDPRSKVPLIQDLTSVPPSPQELSAFQKAVKKITELFTSENAYTAQVESMFGIKPPQGPFYSLMKGRFSDNSAIPAKSPGRPATPYYVRVEIDNGNADSKVISGGTPLRRYPL
jgi:hypothetical protein